jgi:hypothetical protein
VCASHRPACGRARHAPRAAALPCGFPSKGAGESYGTLRETSCRVSAPGDASGGDGPLPPGWQMMTSNASGKCLPPVSNPPPPLSLRATASAIGSD